jgi:hypothetical protein
MFTGKARILHVNVRLKFVRYKHSSLFYHIIIIDEEKVWDFNKLERLSLVYFLSQPNIFENFAQGAQIGRFLTLTDLSYLTFGGLLWFFDTMK